MSPRPTYHEQPVSTPDPLAWCVVCCKPLGDEPTRAFPDGCIAHGRCFLSADSCSVECHMTPAGPTDKESAK